jgi:hypothetical protein
LLRHGLRQGREVRRGLARPSLDTRARTLAFGAAPPEPGYVEPLAHAVHPLLALCPRYSPVLAAQFGANSSSTQAQPARKSWRTIVNHFGDLVNFQ